MKLILTIFSFTLATLCFAQMATFKELKLKPNPQYYNTKELTIIFPIVVTKNPQIDKIINTRIKDEMYLSEEIKILKEALNEKLSEGLINMSYQVTYNGYGLLSFSIDAEGCGVHCSNWTTYFNFDLKTGKPITISDLLKTSAIDSFKNIVQADKIKALAQYKEDEKSNLINNGIDSTTYDWAISQVDDNCINSISIENFALSSNSIEIFDNCEFPHAIRSEEPTLELKYYYKKIYNFLNPRFQKVLK